MRYTRGCSSPPENHERIAALPVVGVGRCGRQQRKDQHRCEPVQAANSGDDAWKEIRRRMYAANETVNEDVQPVPNCL